MTTVTHSTVAFVIFSNVFQTHFLRKLRLLLVSQLVHQESRSPFSPISNNGTDIPPKLSFIVSTSTLQFLQKKKKID